MFPPRYRNGPPGPPQPPPGVNILVVGSGPSDAADIRRELTGAASFVCTAYFCADPAEALAFIRRNYVAISLVFLDLSLSPNPKIHFLQLMDSLPDVPIVVVTERQDADLRRFVMEEGAAENVSQRQLRGDPGRLRNIVESALSRDKIARRERGQNAEDLDICRAQGDAALEAERGRGVAALKTAAKILQDTREKGLLDLKELHAQNKALRRKYDHARSALSGGYPVSRPGAKEARSANENNMAG